MMSDLLNALDEILVGGVRIHVESLGNLGNRQVFVEAQVEDAAVGLFQFLVGKGLYFVNLLKPFFYGLQ